MDQMRHLYVLAFYAQLQVYMQIQSDLSRYSAAAQPQTIYHLTAPHI